MGTHGFQKLTGEDRPARTARDVLVLWAKHKLEEAPDQGPTSLPVDEDR